MTRKLIAILRGISPDEAEAVAEVLVDEGIHWIEVPLNSPEAPVSIERMRKHCGQDIHVGAGTVLDLADVQRIYDVGGDFIVSPNCDESLIRKTKSLGMSSYPGVFTPTECFSALQSGADALKLFPAAMMGTSGVRAIRDVLPAATELYAVGGVNSDNMADWLASGVNGFGIGSALYKPGKSIVDIAAAAQQFVAVYDRATQ